MFTYIEPAGWVILFVVVAAVVLFQRFAWRLYKSLNGDK